MCRPVPPEVEEGGVTLLPELLVLLALHAPHPLHHLLAELHGWRQGLGVAAQDVAEVHVEQLACWGVRGRRVKDRKVNMVAVVVCRLMMLRSGDHG